jgi:hypothetical protein
MPAIRIEGLESLMGKIDTLQKLRMVAAGIKAAALHIKGKMATYPPVKRLTRASVYGSAFQTDKQRRYFFYALKAGLIEVPYRRGTSPGSRTLGRRWTIETSHNGLTATVGNNTPYGTLVQAKDKQSLYHQAVGWQTDEDVIEKERGAVVQFVQTEVQRAIRSKTYVP